MEGTAYSVYHQKCQFFDRSTQVGSFLVSVIILSMNLSIQDYFFLIYTDHGVLLKIQIFNIILYSFSLTKLSLFPFYTTIPPKILLLLSQYLCEKSSPRECNNLVSDIYVQLQQENLDKGRGEIIHYCFAIKGLEVTAWRNLINLIAPFSFKTHLRE